MKKIKLLTPILGLTALSGSLIPLTSCGCSTTESTLKILPEDQLVITDGRLYGIKDETDLSKYNAISIPSSIQFIEANAFNNTNRDYSTIKTLIIDANVRHIGSLAFAGLTSLETIDLSNITTDTIDFLSADQQIVGTNADSRFVQVKLPANLDNTKKNRLIEKLVEAGVPEAWFFQSSEGHVSINVESKEATTSGVKALTFNFELSEAPSEDENIKVQLARTGGSEGTKVELVSAKVKTVSNGSTAANLVVRTKMGAETGHQLVAGETVEYKAIIICENTNAFPATQWIQEIVGFKLTYGEQGVTHVESLEMNPDLFLVVGSTLTPRVTVTPSTADNKEYELSVSDSSIVSIDGNSLIGVKTGTCTVTATSKDSGVIATSNLTVVEPTTNLSSYFDINYYSYSEGDAYYYFYLNSGVTLPPTLIIPSVYDDGEHGEAPVYLDINQSFSGSTTLKNIVLPNCITYIGYQMFYNCTALEQVYIPDDAEVTYIGYQAFAGCTSLTDLYIPNTVVDISYSAFYGSGIKVTNDKDNHVMYYRLNDNDHYLANLFSITEDEGEFDIKFHEDTVMTAEYFYYGYDPETDEWHNNKNVKIKSIDFSECNKLTTISPCSFATGYTYCEESYIPCIITATEITFPESLKYIGASAFMNPWNSTQGEWFENGLKSINLNEGLEYIANGAFYGLQELESITIPYTVESIGTVTIPTFESSGGKLSISKYSNGTFEHCWNLKEVVFEADPSTNLPRLEAIGNPAFSYTSVTSTKDKPFVLPDSIKRLGYGALTLISYNEEQQYDSNLEYISIPESVEYMYEPFFYYDDDWAYGRVCPITAETTIEFADTTNTWKVVDYYGEALPLYSTVDFNNYPIEQLYTTFFGDQATYRYYYYFKNVEEQ